MAKAKLLWMAARTLALAGLSWGFARTAPPVHGICASTCKYEVDSKGHLISIACAGDPKQKTSCYIGGDRCNFGPDNSCS